MPFPNPIAYFEYHLDILSTHILDTIDGISKEMNKNNLKQSANPAPDIDIDVDGIDLSEDSYDGEEDDDDMQDQTQAFHSTIDNVISDILKEHNGPPPGAVDENGDLINNSPVQSSFSDELAAFSSAINWEKDSWVIMILVAFPLISLILTLWTFHTDRHNLNILVFLITAFLIYMSEMLNMFLSDHHQEYGITQNYFKGSEAFLSVFYSGPMLFVCILWVAQVVYAAANEMVLVKKEELKMRARKKEKGKEGKKKKAE